MKGQRIYDALHTRRRLADHVRTAQGHVLQAALAGTGQYT